MRSKWNPNVNGITPPHKGGGGDTMVTPKKGRLSQVTAYDTMVTMMSLLAEHPPLEGDAPKEHHATQY